MKIGVIGVGVIGSAIIEGFCYEGDCSHDLLISKRNKLRSETLALKYSNISRYDNQEILDRAEVIILSVLPKDGYDILESLKFKSSHHVINLMSDKKLEDIKRVIGDTASLTHMVPLSFISNRNGPIALYPKHDLIENLFSTLGQVVSVESYDEIKAIASITGLMTSYYKLLNDIVSWGENNGLTHDVSKVYTTHFFQALSQHGREHNLNQLAQEMTPGGLNQFAVTYLQDQESIKTWVKALDPILMRLK